MGRWRGAGGGPAAVAHCPPRGGPALARALPAPLAAEQDRSGPATMRRLPRAALLQLQFVLLVAAGPPEAPVSAPRSLVWGPGLRAGVVLPVRYFYLQAVSPEGHNLTRSPPGSVRPPTLLARLPSPLVPAARPRRNRACREPARRRRGLLPRVWSPPLPSPSPDRSGRKLQPESAE